MVLLHFLNLQRFPLFNESNSTQWSYLSYRKPSFSAEFSGNSSATPSIASWQASSPTKNDQNIHFYFKLNSFLKKCNITLPKIIFILIDEIIYASHCDLFSNKWLFKAVRSLRIVGLDTLNEVCTLQEIKQIIFIRPRSENHIIKIKKITFCFRVLINRLSWAFSCDPSESIRFDVFVKDTSEYVIFRKQFSVNAITASETASTFFSQKFF